MCHQCNIGPGCWMVVEEVMVALRQWLIARATHCGYCCTVLVCCDGSCVVHAGCVNGNSSVEQ
jgi:hypothetical protein